MKQKILTLLANSGAFAPFRRVHQNGALILMYHRFSRAEHYSHTSQKVFETHLAYLTKYYQIIALQQLADNLRNGEKIPAKTAVITIDDGYADAYDIAFPVLRKFNVPATVFVATDFLDRKCWLWTDKMRFLTTQTKLSEIKLTLENTQQTFILSGKTSRSAAATKLNSWLKTLPAARNELEIEMLAEEFGVKLPELPPAEFNAITWENAREMDKNGVAIESHTVTHPILPNVELLWQLENELKVSKGRLEFELGREANSFCYPNGNYDQRVRDCVEAAGYTCAVTTESGFNVGNEDIFLLKRIAAENNFAHFVQSTSGFELIKNRLRSFGK